MNVFLSAGCFGLPSNIKVPLREETILSISRRSLRGLITIFETGSETFNAFTPKLTLKIQFALNNGIKIAFFLSNCISFPYIVFSPIDSSYLKSNSWISFTAVWRCIINNCLRFLKEKILVSTIYVTRLNLAIFSQLKPREIPFIAIYTCSKSPNGPNFLLRAKGCFNAR